MRTQLVDHLLSVRELELLRAEESTRAEYVSLLETKLAFEDIPRLNVEAARIELARTQLSVKSAQGRVEETRAAVAAALGVPVQALAPARFHHTTLESPPPFEALSLETLEREALMNRLDIRRSLAEYSAIESSLQLELARRVPDIQIGPSFRWRELDRRWVSNLSLPIPLLNRNEGPIAESLARRQQIATNLLVLQSSVVDEIARATARYRASLEQMETANQLLSAAAAREADILELFAVDDVDRTAVVGSRLEVLLAEQGRLAALRRAQMELGTLENAVQVPLESGTAPPISIPQDPKQVRP